MKILVTGAAGFIGYHLAKSLINTEYDLVGIDNLNSYYDLELKKARLINLKKLNFNFYKIDICDQTKLENLFIKNNFEIYIIDPLGPTLLKNYTTLNENFRVTNYIAVNKKFK